MARAGLWVIVAGVLGCGGDDDEYPISQPPVDAVEADAAVDGALPVDAAADARADAMVDAAGAADAAVDGPSTGADLSIEISASPDPVPASATLDYTIDVTNHGGADASAIAVTQRLPPGNVAFVSATGIGWTCAAAGQVITCTRATLLVGAAPSIVVRVTMPATGGTLPTSASVEADTPDPVMTNNDASLDTTVLTPADISIAISDAPDPVAAGGAMTYTITVTNTGPGASTGISVLDSLPSGLGFVSATGAGWSCSAVDRDVTCSRPALAALASAAITLSAIAPAIGGSVTNTALVTATTPDPGAANNQATTTTLVNAAADLSISMTDTPDPVFGSGTLQYAVDVTNLGPNAASGITVTTGLPPGNVVFIGASGSGWSCQPSGQVVTCTRPSLLVGAAPTIAVTVQAPAEATTLTGTASVTSTSSDLESSNNAAAVNTTVLSSADLAVGVLDSADPVTTSGAFSYTVTASNAGPSLAASVAVTTVLPSGMVLASAGGINWACSAIGQQVTCTTSQLVPGTAPPITIAVNAPSSDGTIAVSSSISSATSDPAVANNTASQATVVNAPSDLSLALSASPSPVPAGSTLSYTINVTNLGARDATNLVVTNRLPDGNVLFLDATGIGWACALAGQIVTCTRPLLIVGAAPSITIRIRTPAASGELIDEASVVASTADPSTDNNVQAVTTAVFDSADLSIAASAGPDPVRIGTDLVYTLEVANDGPTSATAVEVVDTLPAGTTFVSASGAGWTCGNAGQDVTCTIASLAAASSAPAITIVATAPATAGELVNTAAVSSATSDPTSANNTATTTTLANAFADLSVAITDDLDPITGSTATGCSPTTCVTYDIAVSNAGPDPATGIRVVTVLPGNGTFFNAVGSGWVCPAPSGTLTCTRTGLAAGATSTISLTWKAPSPGGFSIVVSSTVSATSTDPAANNNAATQDTTVNP